MGFKCRHIILLLLFVLYFSVSNEEITEEKQLTREEILQRDYQQLQNEILQQKTTTPYNVNKKKITKTHFPEVHLLDEINFQKFLEKDKKGEEEKRELTEEEVKGKKLYEEAQRMINEGKNEKAIKILEDSASLSYIPSINRLGEIYENGELGMSPNYTKAFGYYNQSAAMGDPSAQRSLAFLLDIGEGCALDKPLALLYYSFAARSQDIEASLVIANKYSRGIDVKKSCIAAVDQYKRVAEHAFSIINDQKFDYSPYIHADRLDEFELEGDQTEKERELVEYYHFSANVHESTSLVELGYMYLYGLYGVKIDYEKSKYYFEQAAQNNEGKAYAYLGYQYENGLGVAPDINKAIDFYLSSAKLNNSIGMNYLGEIYLWGKHGIPRNYTYAYKLFQNSTTNPYAHLNLGKMHYHGMGIKASTHSALSYFKVAATNDVTEAQLLAGRIYHYGVGVGQDCHLAVEYYRKVASKSPYLSLYPLALSYYKSGDIVRSLHLYKKLSQFGWEIAQTNVAYIYAKNLLGDVMTSEKTLSSPVNNELVDDRTFEELKYYLLATSTYPKANLFIGDYFYYGKGNITPDKETASAFYHSAITLPQAKFNIAYLHHFGDGVPRDLKLAKKYYYLCYYDDPHSLIVIFLSLAKLFFDSFIDFVEQSNLSPFSALFSLPNFVVDFFE